MAIVGPKTSPTGFEGARGLNPLFSFVDDGLTTLVRSYYCLSVENYWKV